ncbi:MAG: ABC transporter ATP-binding protein [Tissierellaceae bacterium]|nr:ABC transporter ATP-binding protein [Tissierellaceae bacterium]
MDKIREINKSFGKLDVLVNVSIDFPHGKTTCILGPSGCGKTTLLNIISGLWAEDSGNIYGFQGDIAYVFQEDRLIPWKNIEDNLRFVLRGKINKMEMDNIIDKYLKLVSLEEYKRYYPSQLSGGMRQRINILRAFIYPSNLIIMDEPFKSLDINTKQVLIDFCKFLREIYEKTCIIVTHDIDEAILLGHRIVILTDKPTTVKKIIEIEEQDNWIRLRTEIEREFTA